MDLKRKVINVELNGKEYEFILDFESGIDFQDLYGKSVFRGLEDISNNQDIFALACLIASCVKDKETEKSVGLDFVKKLDLVKSLAYFLELLPELVDNSIPTEKVETKKK